jgi:hypothetical protein
VLEPNRTATSAFYHLRSGILGRPISRAMTAKHVSGSANHGKGQRPPGDSIA